MPHSREVYASILCPNHNGPVKIWRRVHATFPHRLLLSLLLIGTCALLVQAQTSQATAAEAKQPPTGAFFAALRTQNHISRSSTDKFNEAVDGVEKFLTSSNVVLREDPVRGKFRVESTMSKESVIRVAEDAGSTHLLELIVDRPAIAWISLTMECYDLQGKLLWEEQASGANQFTSSGHVQKAVKKLSSRLATKLGTECLPLTTAKPAPVAEAEKK